MSVISKQDFNTHFGTSKLSNTPMTLKTYFGEKVIPLGVFEVKVEYEEQSAMLKLYVVEKGGPILFGRDWLQKIQLNWKNIKFLDSVSTGI